jgi:hypothetical protein
VGPELLGVFLLVVLAFAGTRGWVSLPLGVLLTLVWLVSLGWLSSQRLPYPAMVGLAQCALWVELGGIVQGRGGPPPEAVLEENALSGFLGGVLGGFGVWFGAKLPGAPLGLAFLGSLLACLVRGGGFFQALRTTVLLPTRRDPQAQSVLLLFLMSVALGAVPR